MRGILLGAIVGLLAIAPAAQAARRTLTEQAAEQRAKAALAEDMAETNAAAREWNNHGMYVERAAARERGAPEWAIVEQFGPEATMKATVDGCDSETRYRAMCDYTLAWSDGTVDENTLDVVIRRSGRLVVRW